MLFPAVFVAGRSGSGGIALLWQQIEEVPDPGPMPGSATARPCLRPAIPTHPRRRPRLRLQKIGAVATAILGLAVILSAVPGATSWPCRSP